MNSKRIFRTAVLAMCLAVTACSPRRGVVDIVFVQTSDIHGHIYADNPLDGSERKGALLKAASYIKELRKENDNVVFLDAGDNMEGSPEVYFDVTVGLEKHELVSMALSYMGCDASVPGNHDINVGALPYDRFMRGALFPVLGGNVGYESFGDFYAPYTIIERQGVRIAVIGLTTPASEYSVPSDIYGELGFADMVESAQYWMDEVRESENPDLVVGLFHSGLEDGRFADAGIEEDAVLDVARNVPGFDMIFFGHDHTAYCDSIVNTAGEKVILVNPGAYCENVGVVRVSIPFRKGNVMSKKFSASLVDVSGMKPERGLERLLESRRRELNAYLDSVVGVLETPIDFDGMLTDGASQVDYIHNLLSRHHAAQVTISIPCNAGESFKPGKFTIRDAFRMYPYENYMVSITLSGREIINALEYSAQAVISMQGGSKEYNESDIYTASGISYQVDCSAEPGKRVTVFGMSDGKPFNPGDYYRVSLNSFTYCGGDSDFYKAVGLSRKQLQRRLNVTTQADIRYYILTEFFMHNERGTELSVQKRTDYRYLGL